MNEQMKALGEEMIQEIKNLKDLTKENLPEVAKEYVRFNQTLHLAGIIGFGVGTFLFSLMAIYGAINQGWTHQSPDSATFCFVVGLMVGGGSLLFTILNLVSYLEFKLQPRRKAIQGITSLFKRGN